ncbi:hypothetical protein E2553_40450 [Paraburkholderia dipogonis]|uniref:Type I restriction endonuclease subunit M n=1 Tax=Paraburkholderia dipogonis TaxID=1211383 RepID=A0A4Y8MJR2_9BURK|nr:hypothetical protein E2553_40450 [Paraburkholderia dipogonis]
MNHAALPRPLFPLGRIMVTPGAIEVMSHTETNVFSLLRRHQRGDWGVVCDADKRANDNALANCTRILSAYVVGAREEKLWLISGADRSTTTILCPDEY